MGHQIQIRAARALLGWSAAKLAEAAGVTLRTIQRLEAADELGGQRTETYKRVRAALEAEGIEFVGDPGTNPGVVLHRHGRDG